MKYHKMMNNTKFDFGTIKKTKEVQCIRTNATMEKSLRQTPTFEK